MHFVFIFVEHEQETHHMHKRCSNECMLFGCSVCDAVEGRSRRNRKNNDYEIEQSGNDLWLFTWNETHIQMPLHLMHTRELNTNIFIRSRMSDTSRKITGIVKQKKKKTSATLFRKKKRNSNSYVLSADNNSCVYCREQRAQSLLQS